MWSSPGDASRTLPTYHKLHLSCSDWPVNLGSVAGSDGVYKLCSLSDTLVGISGGRSKSCVHCTDWQAYPLLRRACKMTCHGLYSQ